MTLEVEDLPRAHVQLFRNSDLLIHWRLLSGNNREIGRGALGLRDVASCRVHVEQLLTDAEWLSGHVRRSVGGWAWTLRRHGVVVARSGRDYARPVRCQQALTAFASALATATVSDTAVDSAARRWDRRVCAAHVNEAHAW